MPKKYYQFTGYNWLQKRDQGLKHAQMVLWTIDMQLKILEEQNKNSELMPEELAEIWEALIRLRHLKGPLSRGPIRKQIIDNHRKNLED